MEHSTKSPLDVLAVQILWWKGWLKTEGDKVVVEPTEQQKILARLNARLILSGVGKAPTKANWS